MKRKTAYRGFTLIELLVTVAVAAVLLSIAAPSFKRMIDRNRAAASVNEYLAALNLARSHSLKQSKAVVLCRTNNPTATSPTCGAGTSWDEGWVIFVDENRDSTFTSGETVLSAHEALHTSVTLTGDGNTGTSITFLPSGELGPLNNGTLKFCMSGADKARKIVLSPVGRARSEEITASGNC